MTVNSLKIFLVGFLFLFFQVDAFAYPALGECFTSVEKARLELYPHDVDLTDPDISTVSDGGGKWVWIVDKTPRVNYGQTLLERVNSNVCYRADIRANSVYLKAYKSGWLIKADEPPVGTSPGWEMTYRMKKGELMFYLTKCRQYLAVGNPKSAVCKN